MIVVVMLDLYREVFETSNNDDGVVVPGILQCRKVCKIHASDYFVIDGCCLCPNFSSYLSQLHSTLYSFVMCKEKSLSS